LTFELNDLLKASICNLKVSLNALKIYPSY